ATGDPGGPRAPAPLGTPSLSQPSVTTPASPSAWCNSCWQVRSIAPVLPTVPAARAPSRVASVETWLTVLGVLAVAGLAVLMEASDRPSNRQRYDPSSRRLAGGVSASRWFSAPSAVATPAAEAGKRAAHGTGVPSARRR